MRIFIYPACLIACLSGALACAAALDDDNRQAGGRTAAPGDSAAVILDSKSQQLSGIETRPLEAVHKKPEFTAYGTVLSLEPLLQLRQQYLAAQSQQDGAKAKYTEAHLNLARTQNLHHQDIVSTRRLQEQQAQWQTEKANLDASGYRRQNIVAGSRLEWGDILTDWFVQGQNKASEQFLTHNAQLLQITLPAGARLNPGIRDIYIDERGQRNTAVKALLISNAPRVDPVSQGERYFFKTEGRQLPFGAHITAWIADDAKQVTGVLIPRSALVWHLGQAFVFIKTAGDRFSRRALPEYTADNLGYFVTGSLQPEEEIVITGAQTLLSQQLKALIPNEDKE